MWSANALPLDKVISIGLGDPYKNLIYMPRTWARINCYSTDKIVQKALANILTGEKEAIGVSPLDFQ